MTQNDVIQLSNDSDAMYSGNSIISIRTIRIHAPVDLLTYLLRPLHRITSILATGL